MDTREAAVLEHQHAVYNLARRLTGSDDLAGELTQEAFLRFLARGADAGPAARAYLCRTVLNLCADRWRRAGREIAVAPPEVAAPGAGPEGQAVRRELREDVRRAVLELPPAYRQVVVLRYYHDLSYKEIGRALGWPASLVRNRLYRARQRLRERLDGPWREAGQLAEALPR